MIFVNGVYPDFVTQTGYTNIAISLALLSAISLVMHVSFYKVPASKNIITGHQNLVCWNFADDSVFIWNLT